jgi:predicted HTH transcriptional regulator
MIMLPNLNYHYEIHTSRSEPYDFRDKADPTLDQRAKEALDLIRAKGPVSRAELESVWGIGRSAATLWLDQLIHSGALRRFGRGRNTKYSIAD